MMLSDGFLKAAALAARSSPGPLVMPWPAEGDPCALLSFSTLAEWQAFIEQLSLKYGIPEIIEAKFDRALKLYVLGWIDADLIKAGELICLTALELALKDRYGAKMLNALLEHMVKHDHLTDSALPIHRKCSGSVVANLYESSDAQKLRIESGKTGLKITPPTTIARIRNSLAHGDPFDGLPWCGLLELARDLIEYAYRDMIAEAAAAI